MNSTATGEVQQPRPLDSCRLFRHHQTIDEETARLLASAGVNSIDGILETDPKDIAEILQVDIDRARQIHEAAKKEHDRKMASI